MITLGIRVRFLGDGDLEIDDGLRFANRDIGIDRRHRKLDSKAARLGPWSLWKKALLTTAELAVRFGILTSFFGID